MGTYLFRWTQPAESVSVTGNFANCNWSNSIRLEKNESTFEKLIHFDSADEPIYYKFIVDGVWKADNTQPTELDVSGNTNNVLSPKDITKSSSSTASPSSGAIGSVVGEDGAPAPAQSSSRDMAASDDKIPGAFPEATPASEPGAFHYSTYTDKPSAGDEKNVSTAGSSDEQAYSVNPIPASSGHGNPVKLEPGEPVPPASELTSNDVQSNVTTDRESYENAGSAPFSGLGGVGAAIGGVIAAGAGAVGLTSLASKDPSHFAHHDPVGAEATHGTSSGDPSAAYTPNTLKDDSQQAFNQDPTGPATTHGTSTGGAAAAVTGAASSAAAAVGLGSSTSGSSPFDHHDPTGPSSTHGTFSGDHLSGYKPNTLKQTSKEAFSDDPTGPSSTHGSSAIGGAAAAVSGAAASAAGAAGLSSFDHHDPVGPDATHGTTLGDRSSSYKANELKTSSHETFHGDPTGSDATHGDSGAGNGSGAGLAAAGIGGTFAAGAAGVASYFGFSKKADKSDKLIPESSLPMGEGTKEVEKDEGPVMRSAAGENTSTSALAGQQPLEPRGVPQVVQDSQAEADAPPEASEVPEAVEDKREVENELKQKVPEEQPTTEHKGAIAGAVGGATAAAAGGLAFASQKAGVPQSIQNKISSMNTGTSQPSGDVPRPVAESYEKSSQDPEAAANPDAIHEKADVERELLKDVPKTDATGEPAPVTTAETSAVAPGVTAAGESSSLATESAEPSSSTVPQTSTSQSKDHGVSDGVIAGAAGAGIGAAALGAGAYATRSHGSTAPGTSASIQDPTTIPSTESNAMIADEDTMPAIAMANREMPADPSAPLAGSDPSYTTSSASGHVQEGSVPVSAYSGYTSQSAIPYTTSGSGAPSSAAEALPDRSVPTEGYSTGGASGSGLAQAEDAPAVASSSPAAAIAARVFGSPTSPSSTGAALASGPTTSSDTAATSGLGGATSNEPISAVGAREPTTASSSNALDTKTGDSALAVDNPSADEPIAGGSTVGPSSATEGTLTSSAAPAPSVPEGPSSATESSATKDAGIGGAGAATAATAGTSTSASGLNESSSTPTKSLASEATPATASKENERKFGQAPAMTKTIPSAREEAESSMGTVFGKEGSSRTAERDVSPFSKGEAGPSTTAGASSKAAPSTPSKTGKTAATGTPASASTSGTAKSEKRKSRLSQWFSEHVGSERKNKK